MPNSIDIYLLNLDRRPDRLSYVASQLNALNLPFNRFSAVDGRDENTVVAPVRTDRFIINHKREPTRTELACAASHIKIWQSFLESDAKYALIIEDDVDIDPAIKTILEKYDSDLQYDFLNLSSTEPYRLDQSQLEHLVKHGTLQRPSRFKLQNRHQWRRLEWRKKWRIFALNPVNSVGIACECDPAPALGSGYILSRKAAEHFLATAQVLSFPADMVWRHSGGLLRQAFFAPVLIKQTDTDSDIVGRNETFRIPLRYRLLRPFLKSRRWKRRLDVLRLYGFLQH